MKQIQIRRHRSPERQQQLDLRTPVGQAVALLTPSRLHDDRAADRNSALTCARSVR